MRVSENLSKIAPVKDVARAFSHASKTYLGADDFQRKMAQKILKLCPESIISRWLDLGCGLGDLSHQLWQKYGPARGMGIDAAWGMISQASMLHHAKVPMESDCLQLHAQPQLLGQIRQLHPRHDSLNWLQADANHLPIRGESLDLLVSNLMLQWCDATPVLLECLRILKPGGTLVISTLLPGTFSELEFSWQQVDDYPHIMKFQPLEHLLSFKGWADGALHWERFQHCEWMPNPQILLQKNRALGVTNRNPKRRKGLMSRHALQKMLGAYEGLRTDLGVPVSYSVLILHWVKKS